MAQLNFNAQQHEPQQAFTPIPEGWYPVMITESEMKPVKPPKQGAYLNLTLTIQGGEHSNRKLFARLNLHNENPVAVEIAQRELSSICHVTGVMQLNDSQQLHGIPFQVKVTVKPAEGQYSAGNEIKGYRDINGNDPGKAAQGGQAPAQVAQGGPQAPQAPQAPQQPQAPQGGGWTPPTQQQPAPPQPQQAPQQQPPQAPPQQPQWNQGGQQVQPQGQPPQQEQAPVAQPQQDQGYVQPPQGGQSQPVTPPPADDQSGVPPWQRQQ